MKYDIYKSAFCGMYGGHDPVGSRQYSWGASTYSGDYSNLNIIFKKAESYNASREKVCSCRCEVKEVK